MRESPWHNPNKVKHESERQQGTNLYRDYLLINPDLLRHVSTLRGKTRVCWCAPKACHGYVLALLAVKEWTRMENCQICKEPMTDSGEDFCPACTQAVTALRRGDRKPLVKREFQGRLHDLCEVAFDFSHGAEDHWQRLLGQVNDLRTGLWHLEHEPMNALDIAQTKNEARWCALAEEIGSPEWHAELEADPLYSRKRINTIKAEYRAALRAIEPASPEEAAATQKELDNNGSTALLRVGADRTSQLAIADGMGAVEEVKPA